MKPSTIKYGRNRNTKIRRRIERVCVFVTFVPLVPSGQNEFSEIVSEPVLSVVCSIYAVCIVYVRIPTLFCCLVACVSLCFCAKQHTFNSVNLSLDADLAKVLEQLYCNVNVAVCDVCKWQTITLFVLLICATENVFIFQTDGIDSTIHTQHSHIMQLPTHLTVKWEFICGKARARKSSNQSIDQINHTIAINEEKEIQTCVSELNWISQSTTTLWAVVSHWNLFNSASLSLSLHVCVCVCWPKRRRSKHKKRNDQNRWNE